MCQNINLSDEKPFHFKNYIKIESKIQYAGFGKIEMQKKVCKFEFIGFFVREMKYQLFSTKTYCLLTQA